MMAGKAEPLGASPVSGGVNFALSAPAASSVLLCLFDASGASIGEELPLTKGESGLWTILLEGCPRSGVLYGYVSLPEICERSLNKSWLSPCYKYNVVNRCTFVK